MPQSVVESDLGGEEIHDLPVSLFDGRPVPFANGNVTFRSIEPKYESEAFDRSGVTLRHVWSVDLLEDRLASLPSRNAIVWARYFGANALITRSGGT